jgi:phage FluMu protein Com
MPDSGTWKLRCPHCQHVFEVELSGSESIVEASRNFRCPACLKIPSEGETSEKRTFHQVVGFKAPKPR